MVWSAAFVTPVTAAALYSAERLDRDLIEALAQRWLGDGHDDEAILELAFPDDLNLQERRALLPRALTFLGIETLPSHAAALWELNRVLVTKLAAGDENYLETLRELVALDLNEDKADLGFGAELDDHMRRNDINVAVTHWDAGGSGLTILHHLYIDYEPIRKRWSDARLARHRTDVQKEAGRVLAAYYGEAGRPYHENKTPTHEPNT